MSKTNFGDEPAYIECEVKRSTEKALLVDVDGDEYWLPRSQIVDEGDGIVAIPQWLADKEGLEGAYK